MWKSGLIICFFLSAFASSGAQDFTEYEKQLYIRAGDTLPYRILLPLNFDASKKYPLVLFLHGSGERGRDNEKQLLHGGEFFLRTELREQFPAIVVFPQCPQESFWSNVDLRPDSVGHQYNYFYEGGRPTPAMQLLKGLLVQLEKDLPIEKRQMYVMGLSMGGMGTFELVRRNPDVFAAAVPICGGANPLTAHKLTATAWWIFHGGKDEVVSTEHSRKMMAALLEENAKVKLTIYPGAKHNSWDLAFNEKGLLPWLFAQHK